MNLKSLLKLKNNNEGRYSKSFIVSLIIHSILFGFLLLSLETTFNPQKMSGNRGEIVQAVVVDHKIVEAEMERMTNEENKEKEVLEKQQKLLTQKTEQVKKEREKEEAKLEKVKQDLARAKSDEEARLAELKLAKAKEQKQLEALKNEKSKEQKRLAALDDQRQVEAERANEMRKQREKEEKRKADLAAKQAAEGKRKANDARQQVIASEVQRVIGEWAEKIRQNKHVATSMPSDLYCKLTVTVLPDGNVQVSLVQSSGNTAFDDLSMRAVYKSQPFPLPEDPDVREQVRSFDLGLHNDEITG